MQEDNMAELFGFKRSTSVTTPRSTPLSVTPNQQLSSAYGGLQKLVEAGMQFKSQEMAQKSQQLNLESQYLRMQDAEYQQLIREQEDVIQTDFVNELNAAQRQAQEARAKAGLNLGNQQEIATSTSTLAEELYSKLPETVQKNVASFYNGVLNDTQTQFVQVQQTVRKNNFVEGITTTMPAYFSMAPEEQSAWYNNKLSLAASFGLSNDQVSELILGSISNFGFSTLDKEDLINNHNFGPIKQQEAMLESLLANDKKLAGKSYFVQAQDRLYETKNLVDTAVRQDLSSAVQNKDQQTVSILLEHGLNEGSFGDEYARQVAIDFASVKLSEKEINTNFANDLFNRRGGMFSIDKSFLGNPAARNIAQSLVEEDLRSRMVKGEWDTEYMSYHAAENPESYKKIIGMAFTSDVNTLIRTLDYQPKDPDERAQQSMELRDSVVNLNKIVQHGYGQLSDDQLLQLSVAEELILNNNLPNANTALRNLRNQGEIKLLPKQEKNVASIYEDLPFDQRAKAHRQYSVLVNSGVDPDQALTLVEGNNKYRAVGGMKSQMSPTSIQVFKDNAIGEASLKFLEEALLSTDENSLLASDPKLRDNIASLLEGTSPTITMVGGIMRIQNEEGDSIPLVMGDAQMTSLKQTLDGIANPRLKPVGVEAMVSDLSTAVSKDAYSAFNHIQNIGSGAIALPAAGAAQIWNEVSSLTQKIDQHLTHLNVFIDDRYNGMPQEEAKARYLASSEKTGYEIAKMLAESNAEIGENWEERWGSFWSTMQAMPFYELQNKAGLFFTEIKNALTN